MRRAFLGIAALLLSACQTTPDGEKVFNLVDDRQLAQMGLSAFNEMKGKGTLSSDPFVNGYVSCVAHKVIEVLPESARAIEWEVAVFNDETPNAFALPGGKIGVHTGILKVAQSEDQLAAVLGHELIHVTFSHAGQRVSQQLALEAAGTAVQMYTGRDGRPRNPYVDAAIGIGGQLGVLLPFSRKHERQADKQGQELMARAGYDPAQAAELWRNMMRAAEGRPPEWLSTHPDPEARMTRLGERAIELQGLMQEARAQGRGPGCAK
jgi:predicted Zn-dependent protease